VVVSWIAFQLWIAGIGGDRRIGRQNGDLKSRKIPLLVATKGNRQNAIRIAFALLPWVDKHRRSRTMDTVAIRQPAAF